MRPCLLTLFLLPCFAFAADAPVTEYKTSFSSTRDKARVLIGNWLGDQPTDQGGRKQWLMKRRADGSYTVYFKYTRLNNSCEVTCETGVWGVSGDIYFTRSLAWCDEGKIQRTGGNPTFSDAYKILELTQDTFRYKFVENNNIYTVRRTKEEMLVCP